MDVKLLLPVGEGDCAEAELDKEAAAEAEVDTDAAPVPLALDDPDTLLLPELVALPV